MPVFTFISPSHSVEESSLGNTLPTHRVDLPISVSLIDTIPHRHTQVCFHGYYNPIKFFLQLHPHPYTLIRECIKILAVLDTTVHACLSSEKRSLYYYQ